MRPLHEITCQELQLGEWRHLYPYSKEWFSAAMGRGGYLLWNSFQYSYERKLLSFLPVTWCCLSNSAMPWACRDWLVEQSPRKTAGDVLQSCSKNSGERNHVVIAKDLAAAIKQRNDDSMVLYMCSVPHGQIFSLSLMRFQKYFFWTLTCHLYQ